MKNTGRNFVVQEERLWKTIVAKQCYGRVEVKTPVGVIDVLSESSIYEIKHISKWKHALGQILAYGYFHPSKTKNLYLFGASPDEFQEQIRTICNTYDVSVKFTDFTMAKYAWETALLIGEIKEKEKENADLKKVIANLRAGEKA